MRVEYDDEKIWHSKAYRSYAQDNLVVFEGAENADTLAETIHCCLDMAEKNAVMFLTKYGSLENAKDLLEKSTEEYEPDLGEK